MDPITLSLAKKYTDETVQGMGGIKGEPGDPGPPGKTPILSIDDRGHLLVRYEEVAGNDGN